MGWLIALLAVAAMLLLPLGVGVTYGEGGPEAKLLIGPVKLNLYPATKGKKKKHSKKSKIEKTASSAQPTKKDGSLTDFLPLLYTVLDFLKDLRRKFRVRNLQLLLIMAGDDPCDLAVNYGKAWAAVGNLMPLLERIFVIKNRNVQVGCDFTQNQTRIDLKIDITITLGRLLGLAAVYGFRVIREYLTIINHRKGGVQS